MSPSTQNDISRTAELLEGLTDQQKARLNQFKTSTGIDMPEAYRLLKKCD